MTSLSTKKNAKNVISQKSKLMSKSNIKHYFAVWILYFVAVIILTYTLIDLCWFTN